MRLPGEHPIATFREWAKIIIPVLAFVSAVAAAVAAWKQFELARDSAERQDRAYVLVKSIRIRYEVNQSPIATVEVQNFGRTPANSVSHVGRCKIVEIPASFGAFDFDWTGSSKTLLAPGTTLSSFSECDKLTAEQFHGLGTGSWAIFVDGEIRYKDIFRKDRFMRYRRMIGWYAGVHGDRMASTPDGDEAN
jgi:hypothetical protein